MRTWGGPGFRDPHPLARDPSITCNELTAMWLRVQVCPFGSFVSGLGTKDSDIDVVITGGVEGVLMGACGVDCGWGGRRGPAIKMLLIHNEYGLYMPPTRCQGARCVRWILPAQ